MTLAVTLTIGLILSINNVGSSRPTDPFYNFKEFMVGASKNLVEYVKRPVLGHRPKNTNPSNVYREPHSVKPPVYRKPKTSTATPKTTTLTTKSTTPTPASKLPLKQVNYVPVKPFVHFKDINLSFKKPSTISLYTAATEKQEDAIIKDTEKVNDALMKVEKIIGNVVEEPNIMNQDCIEKFEQIADLMKEMLKEEGTSIESHDNLKLMEELINEITEEMVATVRAHLAQFSSIEKLEQMKKLIQEIAKGENNDNMDKIKDIEEIIVKMQNTENGDDDSVSDDIKDMKDLIKEVIEETLEDPVFAPNTDETLNKLENMKHIIEELEDNNIEDAPSQSQQQFLEENNPEIPTSVENLEKLINDISNNPDILLEETKTDLDTIEKLVEVSQIIKQVANETSQESIQETDVEIHEKVEELKDIVKEISFRTKENLGGEVTDNVEDMKNLIRDLEKETLMLKIEDLKDANMNGVKELIMKITESSDSGKNDDEVMEILEKLDDMDTIVNELMAV